VCSSDLPPPPPCPPAARKKKAPGEGGAVAAGPRPTEQTDPPTVPVKDLFPSGQFPEGEWQSYNEE
jgi:methionyl aminopeptidase